MDIIPDSEPLRVAESDSRSNTSRSPTKKLTRSNIDGRENVEESLTVDRAENKESAADVGKALFPVGDEEEEDDEEDVPLAAVVSNQEKKSSSGGVAVKGKGKAPADERQSGKSLNARQVFLVVSDPMTSNL